MTGQIVSRSQKLIVEGDHNVVKMQPLWGKGPTLRLWAERGLICWEDERTDGGYGTMTVREACQRVLALSEMAVNSSEDPKWQHERRQIQDFVCRMENVIRQAREQGEPFDNKTTMMSEARRRRKMVEPRKLNRIVIGDDF